MILWPNLMFLFVSLLTSSPSPCVSGINLMKSMFTCEVAAGESTYVESVASAVRSPACWRSTSEHTPTSVRTFANTATLPSKPKVRGQFTLQTWFLLLFFPPLFVWWWHFTATFCCWHILIFLALCKLRAVLMCFSCSFQGNLTKHMKSKAHGKKCQAMGVSESSLDEPESEETGT